MIELRDVCKAFGTRKVLEHFSCEIPSGSVCGIMAPSGSGKTTLLRLILGLEQPDRGSITGVPERKAVVFQEDRLCMELDMETNIRMVTGRAVSREQIKDMLTRLGLPVDQKPVALLSGGMRRRVALARALLYDSGLLVLDEPFTGLDDENRMLAARTILDCRRGRTMLVVTHRREDLELLDADKVILLQ